MTSIKTFMHCSNLTLNKCCKRKVIKKVSEILPNICIPVLSQTFIIETIPVEEKGLLIIWNIEKVRNKNNNGDSQDKPYSNYSS